MFSRKKKHIVIHTFQNHYREVRRWNIFMEQELRFGLAQWISLLYRQVQKTEQIQPDHCDRYQKNRTKKCN